MNYEGEKKQLLAFQQQHLMPEKKTEIHLKYSKKENMSQGFCIWEN